jgi:hypothetical protein
MYSKLHRPSKDKGLGQFCSENSRSCVKLATYLSKEIGENKTFFSHFSDCVSVDEVIKAIDGNRRTLKNKQDKFYMLSYNPSQREVAHLVRNVTGKKVENLSDLTSEERSKVFGEFQNYVRNCMDVYAKNFNRNKELDGSDLVYFGKIEEERHYSYLDEDVKSGVKKKGELKEGFNLHAHVIVSRMDATQTISLSPLSKSRGNTNNLNGKLVKNGFNMKNWQVECFELFSTKYGYIASREERFHHYNSGFSEYKSLVKHRILKEIAEDLKEEKKLIKNSKLAMAIVSPSKKSLQRYIKNKVKEILSENESVI